MKVIKDMPKDPGERSWGFACFAVGFQIGVTFALGVIYVMLQI